MGVETSWSIGDIFNGMMALSNLIGVAVLSGIAISSVRTYLDRLEPEKGLEAVDERETE